MLQVKEDVALYTPTKKAVASKSWNDMGRVYAEIELISLDDMALARRGHLLESEIKKMQVQFMVDSGADYLVINQHIKNQLDLNVIEMRTFSLADGSERELEIAGPVRVVFANRSTNCDAVVLPGDAEPLLGAIPMEAMDVVIHPKTQTLSVNPENPYVAKHYLK